MAVGGLLAAATPARADSGALALRGLDRAVADGRLAPLDAEGFRASVANARAALRWLPEARANELEAVLDDVAAQWRRYAYPRALALFTMLDVNTRHLSRSPLPARGRDVTDVDGVVYRSFPGHGLQFHPLGNFARLFAELTAGRRAEALRLAYALLARAVPSGRGLVWEYYFEFGGGKPPWTSGMAQAVAAHALARADLTQEAARAYHAIRGGLLLQLGAGPWIRLYSFSPIAVLNAQLQAGLSLRHYAARTQDAEAGALAADLLAAAATLFPRFDTGCWSLYALDGQHAPLSYHRYVVSLLALIAAATRDAAWEARWRRLRAYDTPLTITAEPPLSPLYPIPAEGFRDETSVRFALSRCATVAVRLGAVAQTSFRRPGRHAVTWRPGPRVLGRYRGRLSAVDVLGNTATLALRPVTVKRDRTPPRVEIRVEGTRVRWRAEDEGSPWVHFRLLLERAGWRELVSVGRQRLSGSARVELACGAWHVTLLASDSAGNTTRIPLGVLGRSPPPPGPCELSVPRQVTWEAVAENAERPGLP